MNSNKGVLLIDKPSGMTSHDVVAIVRKELGVKKVGHAGTLDPLATGLLIILVGREYTRRQSEFMTGEKEYLCTAQLGIETDTYDIEGQVVKTKAWSQVSKCTSVQVNKILEKFKGKIQQRVPAFSAVKVKGKKLYEEARKGKLEKRDLPVRDVEIKELELVEFGKESHFAEASRGREGLFFTLRVVCSKGTYIRSLIHDIGEELGVNATVTALRRTKSGSFSVKDAQDLDDFQLVSNI